MFVVVHSFSKIAPLSCVNCYKSFDEIPEANVCTAPEECQIIDPIEFAKHGESAAEMDNGFFQRAKELLGMAKV